MMLVRAVLAGVGLAFLAGCGADGEPVKPGVTVSGEARVGVVAKL